MTACWHRTPGGTARVALELSRALSQRDDIDVVGVGPAGVHRWGTRPRPGWEPACEVRRLPAPHQVLYETWNRWRVPRVQLATGKVDVVHATTVTVPPRGEGGEGRQQWRAHEVRQRHPAVGRPHEQRAPVFERRDRLAGEVVVGQQA